MMQYPWKHNRRYNSFAEYVKREFGQRVQKVSINAGFTCPNRDGTLGFGGCTYCNNDAFNPSYCSPTKSISKQLQEGIEFHQNRYRRARNYLAYFQTYSNTYAPLSHLRKIYEEALSFSGVIGLVIGTRPDCIDEEILQYLQHLQQNHYILIEYGIESCYNNTLARINRKHTFEQSVTAIETTARMGIHTGGHLIFGLPGESRQDMLNMAEIISVLPLTSIKFHQLQLVKGTQMARDYQENPDEYNLFTLNEYIGFIVSFAERLNPSIIIERFTGEVPPHYLSGPNWGFIRNDQVNLLIEKEFEKRNTFQGRIFEK